MVALRRYLVPSLGALGFLLLGCVVLAQRPGRRPIGPRGPQTGQKMGRNNGHAKAGGGIITPAGTVEAVVPGYIQIKADSGELWVLQVMPQARVRVTGTATIDLLKVGYFISFVADVDKRRGIVPDPLSELTFFTPTPTRVLGAFPEGGGFAEQAGPRGHGASPPVERFEVAGRISSVKNRNLTVYAPNRYFKRTVQIKLVETPQIALDIEGPTFYSLAKKGDRLTSKGKLVAPERAQVTEVSIELANPLSAPTAGKPARPTAARPTRHPRPAEPRDQPKTPPE